MEDKVTLFHQAINTHVRYTIDATNGKGADRHLLGLRMMLRKDETADIFTDPAYLKTMSFRLSSSNVSPAYGFYGGFGPISPGANPASMIVYSWRIVSLIIHIYSTFTCN